MPLPCRYVNDAPLRVGPYRNCKTAEESHEGTHCLAIIFARQTYLDIERTEVVLAAISLAEKGTLADAYGEGSGPTAHVAPLYPVLLAGVFRIFGTGVAGEIAQEVLSTLAGSLIYALLPWFACCCRLERTAGIAAGLAGAVLPLNFWSETKGSFEAAYAALLLLVAAGWTIRSWQAIRPGARAGMLAGVAWGAALLTSPSAWLPMLGLLALPLVLRHAPLRTWARFTVPAFLIAGFILAPWAIRNRLVLGKTIWSRSNLGLELSLAHNDLAAPDFHSNMRNGVFRRHPHASHPEKAKVAAMGEVAYNQERLNEALSWIRRQPARSLELTLTRVKLFWLPEMVRRSQTLLMGMLTLTAFCGLLLLIRQRHPASAWLASILFTYPALYYIVQAFPRYRYGIDWLLWLTAGAALVYGWQWLCLTNWKLAPPPGLTPAPHGKTPQTVQR